MPQTRKYSRVNSNIVATTLLTSRAIQYFWFRPPRRRVAPCAPRQLAFRALIVSKKIDFRM